MTEKKAEADADSGNQSELISKQDVVELQQQTQCIHQELTNLNNHKLIKTYNSIPRLLWFHLLKGIAFGLGSVLGATVVLSMLVYVLSQMEFIPIIGEWISAILEVVKQSTEIN